jgi:hypothetical protein
MYVEDMYDAARKRGWNWNIVKPGIVKNGAWNDDDDDDTWKMKPFRKWWYFKPFRIEETQWI